MNARIAPGPSPNRRRGAGFTLIEMVIVVAIIIALAGILVPIVTNELEDARRSTAAATTNRIATAITQYMRDTSRAPTGKNGAKTFHFLHSEGLKPQANPFDSGKKTLLERFLTVDHYSVNNWRGPYLATVPPDPWGQYYVVNTEAFWKPAERAWVLSAGPDGEFQTKPDDTEVQGDDIGLFVQ